MSQLRDDIEYTSSWVSEPQGRGTLSILYTCTLTLILCVYTAVHLNIPPAGEPRRLQVLRKIKWMFIAIFAPEVVLYTAWSQFCTARNFCREMDAVRADQGGGAAVKKEAWWRKSSGIAKNGHKESADSGEANSTVTLPPEPFSMVYGFYVVMGGLTVDVSDMHNKYKTLTLTPFGVTYLARKSSWERFAVSDTAIDDKSKADTLAKSLVILQVSWLFLQCVARLSQGRPLTILEVHTLVHAVCAMLMYGLWFKKPLDIRDATVVDSSGFADDLALELLDMPMFLDLASTPPSETSGLRARAPPSWPGRSWMLDSFDQFRSVSRLPSCRENQVLSFQPEQADESQESQYAHDYQIVTPSIEAGEAICTLYPGQILHCGVGPSFEADTYVKWQIESWSLTERDLLRWTRAARTRSKPTYSPPSARTELMAPPDKGKSTLPTYAVIYTRSENFEGSSANDEHSDRVEMVSAMVLMLIMAGYGAIHLALWNSAFPSRAEMILWKVSGCAMVSILVFCILNLIDELEENGYIEFPDRTDSVLKVAGPLFFVPFATLFVFARIFIVTESFLSLRMVPAGVYEGITWADYIPHL